jgi:hypothetical protein
MSLRLKKGKADVIVRRPLTDFIQIVGMSLEIVL